MDLRKVCKDVRGAPRSCRRTGPARQSAMGVADVQAHGTACLHGFDSLLPARGASQWMIPFSNRVQASQAVSQADQANSSPLSHLNGQTPGAEAEHMDDRVVLNRTGPSHVRHASTMEDGQAASQASTLLRLYPAIPIPTRQSTSSISVL
jgi:hypothetical protein